MPKGKHTAALFEVMGRTRNGSLTPTAHAPLPASPRPVTPARTDAANPNQLSLDPDRHEMTVRMTYTTGLIIAFALVTAVVLALLAGREWGHHAQATADLQKGPAHPEVLNISPGRASPANPDALPPTAPPMEPVSPEVPTPTGAHGTPPNIATPGPNGKLSRTVGLNYIIAQSYPNEVEAKAVADLLAAHNIPATVERIPTWNAKGYTVVTAEGFPPKSGQKDIDALRQKIDQLSAEQKAHNKAWKMLTPAGFRWTGN